MNKKIIFMPHANIQYSQLAPERRYWVMKNCYEKLFDLIDGGDYKIAFEASGITIEEMANQAPEVLAKLKRLVAEGKIEPVSSPYIHFMLANIPKEVCVHSLKHSLDIWEKYIGKRPVIGWNPECGWASYIPDVYKEAGMEALVMDADSLMLSFDEIRQATGLQFDVAGHSNKNHLFKIEEYIKDKPDFLKYITNPSVAPNGLKMIFRSDCMANLLLWYLMGATEGLRAEPINMGEIKTMLKNWQERIEETGSFIMPYAEDAEYIGSSAYFYVKQFNEARFFEEEPESVTRFKEILDAAKEAGYEYATPSEVLAEGNVLENNYVDNIENGVAWHGGTAKAWANTEYSRIMDPVCMNILNGIKAVAEKLGETLDTLDTDLNNAMLALASAWVSDSRWPPAPTSPGRFNVRESLDDMYKANECIEKAMENGGIAEKRGLYSPNLMRTQIKAIDDLLMGIKYFGE
ncbi:MAG: glycoside hydrolase family 57 [Clostridiales bacterium]|nr:glycoside hydrolase family 57 [Clostridiales bacterium]